MLPPQSQQHLNRLSKQDTKELLKKQNGRLRSGSQNPSSASISFFQSEYDAHSKPKSRQSKRGSQISQIKEVNQSQEFATFGKDINFRDNQRKQSQKKGSFDFKKFNKAFQDDLSYLIRYAVTSNAQKYSLSPRKMEEMKQEIQGQKKSVNVVEQKDKAKKQNDFLERNYNKQFKSQQEIFDKNRERKRKMKEDAENDYEKIDPAIWKTSLALMKYQVSKDTYQIENIQREKKNEYEIMNFKNAEAQYQQKQQEKEEQKLKDRKRKGPQARTISVKIQMNESEVVEGYKKPVFKSEDEVEKDVRRLLAINQRQVDKEDKKINSYFIRIQRRIQMLYKLQPGLEKENYRNILMTEIRDNEQIFKDINDQIVGKYQDYLVESIIDDILLENVYMLEQIEKKQKLRKKQLRQAVLNQYKQCFIEYFDDTQEALLNLVYVGKPKPEKVIRYDHIFIETGYGLLLSAIDNKNKFNVHRTHLDYSDKNNVALLNIIARDIALELVDEVAETFDSCTEEFADQLFTSEFS